MSTELVSRFDTIGHSILDLEAELGANGSHRGTLDKLIEEAMGAIQVKDTYTREDALRILGTINRILENEGLEQRGDDGSVFGLELFHEGLGSKKIDCDNTSFIYLSIADALNLPLVAVSAPQHVFVRFVLDREEINWETTGAIQLSNNYYLAYFNISDQSIDERVYLRNLTLQETMALVYNNIGNALNGRGNLDGSIAYYDEAIRLNPNMPNSYNNKGVVLDEKKDFYTAIGLYDRAIELDPHMPQVYLNRGRSWGSKGNLDKAFSDYDEAIRLKPDYAKAYKDRGLDKLLKLNLTGATDDFIRAVSLDIAKSRFIS
jgi:tetratricopeptide (TPR) repeat protein